jgi:hypothetical protein
MLLGVLCLAATAQEFRAAPGDGIRPVPENFRFANGQKLQYNAEWRLWNAGSVTLETSQAGGLEKFTATASSKNFAAVLYHVYDRFESYLEPHSYCSVRITKHTEEGFRRRETTINFDKKRGRAVLEERNPRNNSYKREESETPGCVTDVVSGIFYLSTLPLEVGSTYLFPINDGGKTVNVRAYVAAREEIKTDAGTFKTVRVEPTAPDSPTLKARGKVWVWYTDDAQHIPVQMRSRLFWGTLTFRLAKMENSGAK